MAVHFATVEQSIRATATSAAQLSSIRYGCRPRAGFRGSPLNSLRPSVVMEVGPAAVDVRVVAHQLVEGVDLGVEVVEWCKATASSVIGSFGLPYSYWP